MDERAGVNPLIPSGYDLAWSALLVAAVVLTVVAIVQILRDRRLSSSWRALLVAAVTVFPLGARSLVPRPRPRPAHAEGPHRMSRPG